MITETDKYIPWNDDVNLDWQGYIDGKYDLTPEELTSRRTELIDKIKTLWDELMKLNPTVDELYSTTKHLIK